LKRTSVILVIATIGILTSYAAADGPTVKSLEGDITTLIANNPATPPTDDNMLKLNDLKVSLMSAIDSSIAQLTVDKAKVSGESQDALQIVIAGRQAERKSVSLSLGKWSTGIGGGGAVAVAVPVPAAGAAVPLGSCSLSGDLGTKGTKETVFKYTVNCSGGVAPTSIAVDTLGKINKTVVAPTSLVGLNSAQYGTKGARPGGTVSLSVTKGSSPPQSFELHIPNDSLKDGGTNGRFYVASGTADISNCISAPTTSGCFNGGLLLPAIHEDNDLEVDQMFQALIGATVSGASGTDPRAAFLADGRFDLPLTHDRSRNIAATTSVSAYAKIGTMQSPSSLASLVSATNPTDALSSITSSSLEKIVQSFELGGSLGFKVLPLHHDVWRAGDNVFTLSLIGGGGMLTPLSPSQANAPLFIATADVQKYYTGLPVNNPANETPPPLEGQFNTACTVTDNSKTPPTTSSQPCYAAVYPADRATFFRYYGGGLRLKMYFKDTTAGHSEYRFPGNLDVTVGQNEYVTGGKLHGWVLRFGGTVPVPKVDYLYINLGMDTAITKTSTPALPLLTLAPASGPVDSNTVKVRQPQFNRDRYSVGLSFDIAHFLTKDNNSSTPQPTAPTITTQPTSTTLAAVTTTPLSVVATGDNLTYQWYMGPTTDMSKPAPSPSNNKTYTPTATGSYWVKVSNGSGAVNSDAATITP